MSLTGALLPYGSFVVDYDPIRSNSSGREDFSRLMVSPEIYHGRSWGEPGWDARGSSRVEDGGADGRIARQRPDETGS